MFERLHPAPGPVSPAEVAAGLHADRPRLFLDMIATVDGRATIGGRSGPIGGDGDEEMFHLLRTIPDAVLVGTGTLRAEGYGRLVRRPERRRARVAAGLEEDPWAVFISRSGDLPWDAPIFSAPEQRVLIFTRARVSPPTSRVEVVPEDDPAAVFEELAARGIRSVLCEGGPRLNRSLLEAGLVDELFLTIGPLLAGGDDEPGIVAGEALAAPVGAELAWVLRHGDELFLRYRL